MTASTAFDAAHTVTIRPTEKNPPRWCVTSRRTLSRIRSTAAGGTMEPSAASNRSMRSGTGRNASRLASVKRQGKVAKSR